jgi:hypothetical protein
MSLPSALRAKAKPASKVIGVFIARHVPDSKLRIDTIALLENQESGAA